MLQLILKGFWFSPRIYVRHQPDGWDIRIYFRWRAFEVTRELPFVYFANKNGDRP